MPLCLMYKFFVYTKCITTFYFCLFHSYPFHMNKYSYIYYAK